MLRVLSRGQYFISYWSHPRGAPQSKPFRLSELLEHLKTENLVDQERLSIGADSPGVLVVDDEPAVRVLLQAHLGQHGYRVWATSTGEEALEHFWSHADQISVVLLDIQMPGLDGPQTLDCIRHVRPEVPVCFMSGDPGSYAPSDLLARGARFIFRKPLCLDEVLYVVQHLTEDSAAMSNWLSP